MRIETDKIGTLELPEHTLYGIHTARARQNFCLGSDLVNPALLKAMILVKKAAALAHLELKELDEQKARFIIQACDKLLENNTYNKESFPLHPLQGGAGTSTNMNVNEVIANTALSLAGYHCGEYSYIHPLDDVNKSQSTNDVYPTALRIAAIYKVRQLSRQLSLLQEALQNREQDFEAVIKLGRTELMDALPITLGQEFGCYAQAIARDRWRIYKVEERLRQVNLGGTAVGTGSNASKKYTYKVVERLRDLSGLGLAYAEYPMDLTQNNDIFVEVSGLLKTCAVNLMKISSDLRLMNSGPNGGLGEIRLEELQAGSTIMPGKVNPVIPEMVTQVAMDVMAKDQAVSFAAASGQLELNAFLPLIAHNILGSLDLLISAVQLFREHCILTLIPNEENCKKHLNNTSVLITALVPFIGYDAAALAVKECHGNSDEIKQYILENELLPKETLDTIFSISKASTYIG
ncbi:aspartate ammonia-lyase [Anaeromicropila populeti]|uniref:Aspartate ammonia-lyase n=1 Tax=Anaeromicropila populeti TaxID=37658 RepID=A0A1I6KW38_9FIRM|nr:aspartate ammonia-lyase [Anaeromicropila populeti]SFR95397.1 aspartate ammonia-lyase [Anaeromicropila populeti]